MGKDLEDLAEEVLTVDIQTKQPGYLANNDGQAEAEHEASRHGVRDEPGHEAQVERAEQDQNDPDQDRESSRERTELGRVSTPKRRDKRSRYCRRRRSGADDELPRGSEQAVGKQSGERCV